MEGKILDCIKFITCWFVQMNNITLMSAIFSCFETKLCKTLCVVCQKEVFPGYLQIISTFLGLIQEIVSSDSISFFFSF